MDFFLYAILISLFYIYSGIGLSFLLCPKHFEKYSLYLSPFVGLAYLSYCSWFFFEYSSWGTNGYAGILLIPPLFFLIMACVIKKDRFFSILFPFKKENLLLIFLCITIFLAISFPYYSKIEGISNTITLGNNDIADYAATSKYLMLSSNLHSSIPFVSDVTPRFSSLLQNTYFSAFLSTALPSSIFGLQSYQIQNLTIFLFFAFCLPIIFLIGIKIFNYSNKIAFIITLLVGINFHLFYIIYQGFLGQCVGTGFFLGLIFITYYPILTYNKFSEIIIFLPLNVLFCFGLLISYNILIPLFIIPAILFIVLYSVYSRSKLFLVQSIGYISLTFFITFLISPLSFIHRIVSLISINNLTPGWDMPVLIPNQIFGLVWNNIWLQPEPILIRILFSLPVVLLIIFSFYNLFKNEKKLFYLFGSYLGFVIIFYCFLVISEFLSPSFTGEGYKAYKLISYFIPIILLTGLFYFKDFQFAFASKNFRKKIFIFLFLFILIIWNISSALVFITESSNRLGFIKENIIDLQKISKLEDITSINIQEPPYWNQMWIYYFLFDKKNIYLKYSSYHAASPQLGQWTLKRSNQDILSISNFTDSGETIMINPDYYLVKNNSFDALLKTGWYNIESNQNAIWRWTGANNETPSILINNYENEQYIAVNLNFSPLNPGNKFSVLLDDKKIMDCPNDYCEIDNIYLSKGEHILIFDPKLPPQFPQWRDSRYLGYKFENITIRKSFNNMVI